MLSMIGPVIILLFLVPAWVGTIALRKSSNRSGVKVMFVGCILASSGVLAAVLLSIASRAQADLFGPVHMAASISYMAIPLGVLVFMIGFALHGMQVRRLVDRVTELETILTAQQEQLSRTEGKG